MYPAGKQSWNNVDSTLIQCQNFELTFFSTLSARCLGSLQKHLCETLLMSSHVFNAKEESNINFFSIFKSAQPQLRVSIMAGYEYRNSYYSTLT